MCLSGGRRGSGSRNLTARLGWTPQLIQNQFFFDLFVRGFDFTAPRAWGCWRGKQFSNTSFRKLCWEKQYKFRILLTIKEPQKAGEGWHTLQREGTLAGEGHGTWATPFLSRDWTPYLNHEAIAQMISV